MKEFYYQIKARKEIGHGGHGIFGSSNWEFPPVFCGKVEAKDKKAAKLLIEDEYGREFPLRVLNKDLEKHHYLLNISEIKEDDERTKKLFNILQCEECNSNFRIIDKYNDHNERDKGSVFCTYDCKLTNNERNKFNKFVSETVNGSAYIYKITNKENGMTYIGKTQQVFTLRWYQHFYHGGSSKFHNAIKEVSLENWVFEILEVIKENPKEKDFLSFVLSRESFWISKFDSIEKGYNSIISKRNFDETIEKEIEEEIT